MRITKVVTKTGDDGSTALAGGKRVSKASERVESYGDVDELNSQLGVARAFGPSPKIDAMLTEIQHQLFVLGADLATPPSLRGTRIEKDEIAVLEGFLEDLLGEVDPLKEFVLPGGNPVGAHLQLARAVARRAERRVVALEAVEHTNSLCVIYLNRLSDLLFVMARHVNITAGAKETQAIFKKAPAG